MPALLVVLFILVPLAEILVILQVGQAIGGWWTAGLLVADSLLGAWLLRVEGRRAWSQFRIALQEGRWPGDEVAQGALVIVGGTLLLTPGFLTDVLGFLFLIAPTRRFVSRRLRARVAGGMVGDPTARGGGGPAHGGPGGPGGGPRGSTQRGGPTGPGGGMPRGGTGPGRGTPRTGDDVRLDVEVVEIRREQGPRAVSGGGEDDGDERTPPGDEEEEGGRQG
ncbi:MAG: FxsA family protein [Nitriliruptor sp.]|nr:MAG: FxsA family protein [Nitriliruptor sp.]